MGSLAGTEGKVLVVERNYVCKICGKAFSSGRILGGHVRGHQASAASAAQSEKSPVSAEKSESDSCLTDRAGEGGSRDSGKSPRESVESIGMGKRKMDSWSRDYRCGLCGKGFGSKRALCGHMRIHPCSKQHGKGLSNGRMPSPVSQVMSEEIVISSQKSIPEEALSECDLVFSIKRRKRSARVVCSRNESVINDYPYFGNPLSTLLPSDLSKDEVEAVIGLLMISTGVGSWKYSDDVKNSSGFMQIGNKNQVLDDLLPGVGDKRRMLGEAGAAAVLKVLGTIGSLLVSSNVKEKVIKYQVNHGMTSGDVEVPSLGTSIMAEKMRRLMERVLEVQKLPDLISVDELGGGNRERMIPETGCRTRVLTFQRRGYKCRSCGRIFSTRLNLGQHRVTSCCCSASTKKTDDEKVSGEDASSPSNANCPDLKLSIDGSGGESLNGDNCSDDKVEKEVAAVSERDGKGALLLDLNLPAEVLKLEKSIWSN